LSATITPASYDFGVVVVPGPVTNTFTITNTSTVALSPGSISVGDTHDYSTTTSCGTSLAVNASCSIALTFTPQTAGPLNTTLQAKFTSGTQSTAVAAPVTGQGATTLTATLNPSSYNFQTVVTGTSAQTTFTLTNTNNGTISGLQATILGAASLQITGGTCGTTLASGASCTYVVSFSPTSPGAASASINIASNGFTIAYPPINGTGILPRITLTPPSADIGVVALGSSATATSTLTNPNAFAITGISASLVGMGPNTGLSLGGGTCGSTLAANASCTYTITFAPTNSTGAGSQIAYLTVTASNASNANATFTGENAGLTAIVTPATFDFGSVAVNDPVMKTFTLTNTSPAAVSVFVSMAGDSTFNASATTCGMSLAAGASCSITVTFTPTTTGSVSTLLRLTLESGTQSTSVTSSITGTGAASIPVTLSPFSYNFQTVVTGTTASTTFTLTNASSGSISGLQATLFGDPSLQITGGNCGAALAAGASCTYVVSFSPTIAGAVSGTLNIASDTYTISSLINGTGILPRLTLTPATYNFSNIVDGTTATTTATLTNANAFDVTGLSASFTGPFFEGLSLSGTTCGSTLAAGASCTYTIAFTPASPTGGLTVAPEAKLTVTGTNGASGTTIFTGQGALPTLTLSPATPFGNVIYGMSPSTTVTLSNPNAVSVTGISATFQSTSIVSGLALSGTTCGSTLAANASCTYTVTYTSGPTVPGMPDTVSATLTVSGTNANSASDTFTGSGVPPPLALSPASYNFGNVLFGGSATTTVTLNNPNSSSISGIVATLAGSTGFGMSISGTTCTSTLAANASCTYTIAYTPNAPPISPGSDSGTLTISGANGASGSATFTGSGTQPVLTLSPATYNFGAVAIGSSAITTIALGNANPVSVSGITAFVNDVSRLGVSITGGSCGTNTALAANATCTYIVTYSPMSASSGTAPLVVSYGSLLNGGTVVSSLSGQGAPLTLTLSPAIPFGNVTVGSSASTSLTLTNNSSVVAASPNGVTLSGSGAAAFSETSNCPAMLAPNASCTIIVALNTSTAGSFAATLSVTDNAANSPQMAALSATVVGVAQAVLSPTSLNFGTVNVGSSVSQTVTLSNPGTGPLSITGFPAPSAAQFFLANSNCPSSLAPGASCTGTIVFTPTAIAPVSGTEAVSDSIGTQSVSLSGSGLQAIPVITPLSLTFPDTVFGTVSPVQTVQFANSGNINLAVTSVAVGGPGFAISASTCGSSLAAGAACSVSVQFTPGTTGTFATNLIFVNSAGTQNVPLAGNGIVATGAPDFTLTYTGDLLFPSSAPGLPPPAQLTRDGEFKISVQVASISSSLPFTGTVTINASGLEPGTIFYLSAQSVVPGTQPQTVVVRGQLPMTAMLRQPFEQRAKAPGVLALAGLLGICFFRPRGAGLRSLRLLLGFVCLLPLTLTVTGCGLSDGYSLPNNSGVVTITGASGSVVHSIQVPVVVHIYD
jgi:hypothetical protein